MDARSGRVASSLVDTETSAEIDTDTPAESEVPESAVPESADPAPAFAEPGISARRAATQTRLLDAAREIFAERGINAASVEEICERAGFTRGAFYSNFADKDELIIEVVRREERALVGRLHTVVDSVVDHPTKTVDDIVELILATQPVHREYFLIQTELSLQAVRRGSAGHAYHVVHEGLTRETSNILQSCLDAVGRRLTIPMEDAVEVLTAIFVSGQRLSLIDGDAESLNNLARSVVPQFLESITAPN